MKRAYYIIRDILQSNLILKTFLKWFIIENVLILKVDILKYTTSQKNKFQALCLNLIFSKTFKFDFNTFYYEQFKELENKPKKSQKAYKKK